MAYISVTRENGDLEFINLTDTKEDGYNWFPFLCHDGVTRYALLGESSDSNASHLWIKQNGVKKYFIRQPNVTPPVYLTTGHYFNMYGFCDFNGVSFGAISGTFTYKNKTVTVVMFQYSSGYVDFAMQVDGETSGTYNATVTLIDTDTGKQGSMYFNNINYQSYNKAFADSQTLKPGADLYDFFSASNVGKKYVIKVDIAKV